MIEDWKFTLNYQMRAGMLRLIPFGGALSIDIAKATAYAAVKLEADNKGLLYPVLEDLNVDFGDSKLNCDNGGFLGFRKFWLK